MICEDVLSDLLTVEVKKSKISHTVVYRGRCAGLFSFYGLFYLFPYSDSTLFTSILRKEPQRKPWVGSESCPYSSALASLRMMNFGKYFLS